MKQRTHCTIEGCGLKHSARGYCRHHYYLAKRAGEFDHLPSRARTALEIAGQRFGALTAVRKVGNVWECHCDCGATGYFSAGNLNAGTNSTCGNLQVHHRVETPTYYSMHQRVWSARGKATSHTCVTCGGQAHEWAYDHTDPNELTVDDAGRQPFSLDVSRYQPMCRKCHAQFDEQGIKRLKSGREWAAGAAIRLFRPGRGHSKSPAHS